MFANYDRTEKNDDLMKRISAFLPQIDAANKKITNNNSSDSKQIQMDINLTLDCDDSDSESETSVPLCENDAVQIELKVALGNFDQNPIAMLEESMDVNREERVENDNARKNSLELDCRESSNESKDFVKTMLSSSTSPVTDTGIGTNRDKKTPQKKLIEEIK